MIHPSNTTNQIPALNDLISPSFGTSFLKNGEQDAIDPWGRQNTIAIEPRTAKDGITQIPFVHTSAPDGTAISQYGIGPAATPPSSQ